MLNVLEELRRPVYELMHSGATVTIEQEDLYQCRTRRKRYLTSVGTGLNKGYPALDCFKLSKEQWEQEAEECRLYDPSHFHFANPPPKENEYEESDSEDDTQENEVRRRLKERWGWKK